MAKAACKGQQRLFYSLSFVKQEQAKKICNDTCPVRRQCLAYAILNKEEYGVWGGTIYEERKRVVSLGAAFQGFEDRQHDILNGVAAQQVEQEVAFSIVIPLPPLVEFNLFASSSPS